MRKLNIKLVTLAIVVVGFVSGCKKFLDVNESPNQPTEANIKLLLPSAQAATAHALSNHFGTLSGLWAQYWTQNPFSSQYRTQEQYLNQPSTSNNPWAMLYAGALQDYKRVLEGYGNLSQHAAIAYIMKAYTFQMITDAWGDVPVRGALNEGEELNVAYDTQKEVYDSIFKWIDQGLALANPASPNKVGSEDLVFQGNMTRWIAFANTLKLRAYLRLSEIDGPRSEAGVRGLAGKPFLTVSGQINYSGSGGNENPMFSEILGLGRTQNLVASNTFLDAMRDAEDPRINALYTTTTWDGVEDTIVGMDQGDYGASPDSDPSFPSTLTGGLGANDASATAPVVFISAAESYFLQAEAQARGWFSGSAQTNYEKGITASFEADGIGSEAAAYISNGLPLVAYPAAGTLAQKLEVIITQKYFAMNGWQTFEAWTEQRRTGYPTFFNLSQNAGLGNAFPARFPYPETEANTNGKFPGHPVNNAVHVWWDKN